MISDTTVRLELLSTIGEKVLDRAEIKHRTDNSRCGKYFFTNRVLRRYRQRQSRLARETAARMEASLSRSPARKTVKGTIVFFGISRKLYSSQTS